MTEAEMVTKLKITSRSAGAIRHAGTAARSYVPRRSLKRSAPPSPYPGKIFTAPRSACTPCGESWRAGSARRAGGRPSREPRRSRRFRWNLRIGRD